MVPPPQDELVDSPVKLGLHVALDVGPLANMILGGVGGRWEYLVASNAFLRLAKLVEQSQSGEVKGGGA